MRGGNKGTFTWGEQGDVHLVSDPAAEVRRPSGRTAPRSPHRLAVGNDNWRKGAEASVCYATVRKLGFPTSMNENHRFMNTTGKIQNKGQVTIPTAVRRQAGLSKGDLVNFEFQRGKIVMTPKLLIDRSRFPTADDEYTPAQRRIIDARLAKADADIRAGRVSKAFSDHGEFSAALHNEAAKLVARKTKRPAK